MGDTSTPKKERPRKVLFLELPADLHAGVFDAARDEQITASVWARAALKRALYAHRKERLAA